MLNETIIDKPAFACTYVYVCVHVTDSNYRRYDIVFPNCNVQIYNFLQKSMVQLKLCGRALF